MLKSSFVLLVAITGYIHVSAQFSTTMSVRHSAAVGDDFEIYLSLPHSFDSLQQCNVVYYCDANLKSGHAIRKMLASGGYDARLNNTVFVGIGHIGNYHVLRRRDFILPSVKNGDTVAQSKNYGQVANFYTFLKDELVPAVNARFKVNTGNNSLIGHSLGGLFAFYCLFRSDDLFTNYFALSPALWIDKYSIYKFNTLPPRLPAKKYLYFAAGSNEIMNHILKGTDEMKKFLDEKQYANLQYEYMVEEDKTHNAEVPVSLNKILSRKLKQ